jgi:hypothetical protein
MRIAAAALWLNSYSANGLKRGGNDRNYAVSNRCAPNRGLRHVAQAMSPKTVAPTSFWQEMSPVAQKLTAFACLALPSHLIVESSRRAQ